MRKIFLSLLLQISGTPALGRSLTLPVPSSRVVAHSGSYAPQLRLTCILNLQEGATVEGGRFYVDEVAKCEGPTALCREIGAIEGGPSPKPGQEVRLKSQDLLAIVQTEFPQHQISMAGSPEAKIRASSRAIDASSLRQAIEEKLAQDESQSLLRFRLQTLRVPQLVHLRHGEYSFEFPDWAEQLQRLKESPRRTFVPLRVRAVDARMSGGEIFEWQAQLGLKAEVLGLVADRALARGSLMSAADVKQVWLPYQENLLKDSSALKGKSLRMAVSQGQALRTFELAQEPDVRRGERIEAAILSSGVKMNASGQAMETGSIGQKIRVQLDSTKRQVMGLIIARAQVEVHLP